MDCSPPGSSVHGDPPGKNTRVGYHALHQGIFPTRSPTLQADSLPSEPPGKPKNTGVGSLFVLQEILLTQKLNQGLLLCWWILYQLSYQESPLKRREHWNLLYQLSLPFTNSFSVACNVIWSLLPTIEFLLKLESVLSDPAVALSTNFT